MDSRSSPSGLLLVDKPAGPTSHDVVERVRRGIGIRRVGHAGTLDPFATGLLLLCVGRATRLVEYLHLLPKQYVATLRLGVETDTHDPTGEVVSRDEGWREVDEGALERAVARFRGTISQVPPAYSAKKVEGRRAHRAARAGEPVELEAEEVRVLDLRILEVALPDVRVEARVGTGTYVRSLARDLGRSLGCGAHLTELRRIGIGEFDVQDALPPEAVDRGLPEPGPAWRTPAQTLYFLPRRVLDAGERERVRHGRPVAEGRLVLAGDGAGERRWEDEAGASRDGVGRDATISPDAPVAMVYESGLVAVGERRDGRLHPRKVFETP